MEGCGRGGLSAVVTCCGRACEFIVCGSLADGIRFRQRETRSLDREFLYEGEIPLNNDN